MEITFAIIIFRAGLASFIVVGVANLGRFLFRINAARHSDSGYELMTKIDDIGLRN